ncbi:hypothetical protein NC797_06920 [Aquibacillus sp. 3ASR75-11]|uniref:Uncharacterized protein n=1 Tax=Terrihalobacillus insolitus TaxID=2950438 RepID=A0A9X4ALX9_9BACI|nr:hypothetical protein [Terrihalobacillus insolitus]MDC3424239.1 hypothetical protein [Terrihalobacillus insolitus]
MGRTYSQLELLNSEIERIESTRFVDRLFYVLTKTKKVVLKINIPSRSLFRVNILCEDVTIVGEFEEKFTLSELTDILFKDFLDEVRKNENFDALYNRLKVRSKKKPTIRHNDCEYEIEQEGICQEVKISIERSAALRGEVLLSDLTNIYPNHMFQLESLLELILLDFLIEYSKGNTRNVVSTIINKL